MCLIITHAQILYSGVLCVEHIPQREAKLGSGQSALGTCSDLPWERHVADRRTGSTWRWEAEPVTEDSGWELSQVGGRRVYHTPLGRVGSNRVEGTWEKQGSQVKNTNLPISGRMLALASWMIYPVPGGVVEKLKQTRHLQEFPKLKHICSSIQSSYICSYSMSQ